MSPTDMSWEVQCLQEAGLRVEKWWLSTSLLSSAAAGNEMTPSWDGWGPGVGLVVLRIQGPPDRAELSMAAASQSESKGQLATPTCGLGVGVSSGPGHLTSTSGLLAQVWAQTAGVSQSAGLILGTPSPFPEAQGQQPMGGDLDLDSTLHRHVPVGGFWGQRIYHAVIGRRPGSQCSGSLPECGRPAAREVPQPHSRSPWNTQRQPHRRLHSAQWAGPAPHCQIPRTVPIWG